MQRSSSTTRMLSLLLAGILLAGPGLTSAAQQPSKAPTKKRPAGKSAAAPAGPEDWTQWGGARRNFTTNSTGLSGAWPAGGPKQLWSRELGEGYSGIVAEGGRLYTMYRIPAGIFSKAQEAVVALDAASGKTIWEHKYDAPLPDKVNIEYGPGPHSTPLVLGDRIFTVGAAGHFFALEKATGRPIWSHDFQKEYGVVWGRGYSCSPLAYKDTVILTLGKKGRSVIAFDQKTGAVVWEKQDFDYGPGSPILINVDGEEQLVAFMAGEIIGLNPATGDLLWTHPHKTDWGLNISTPVWGPGNLLFMSSAYSAGSRVIQLTRAAGKTAPKELWFNNRMRIHIGNAIRIGDIVYGSSGDFGPAFFAGVDVKTGSILWRDRSFSRAVSIYADSKLVLLDEDGNLALAMVSPEGLKVLARAEVLSKNAWTQPTLVGTRLYLRDRKVIRAYDLG